MRLPAGIRGPLVVFVVWLAIATAGTALGSRSAPAHGGGTYEALGAASSSYLHGLRTYGAAVLWNRIEPLLHAYYGGVPLGEQRYMLSTIAAVQWLDPAFAQSYYVGAWILARNDRAEQALEMASAGVDANPGSGLLRAAYAQVLMLFGEDLPAAVREARLALSPGVRWVDLIEQHDSYAVLRSVFTAAGDADTAAFLAEEIERLDHEIGDELPAGSHDHDGDGVPDH